MGNSLNIDFSPLDNFVAENIRQPVARCRMVMGPITLYSRLAARLMGTSYGRTLDLADIEVERSMQGQGAFRALLEHAEPLAAKYGLSVYVESIISDKVRRALAQRGYEFSGVEGGSGWLIHAELCRRYPGSSPEKSD
jgi:GNAT superfamily N-acetyltransferase